MMNQISKLDRRTMIAGSIATGIAAASVTRAAFAQDSTPEAEATPSTSDTTESQTAAEARGQHLLDRLDAQLASVQADLAAVRDQIDATTIDAVLTQASNLLAQAQTSFDAATEDGTIRAGVAAMTAIEAAGTLIDAQLSHPGLPSDQIWSSQALARSFEIIENVAADITGSSDSVDVNFYIDTAQSLYTSAYDLYGTGSYAQAGLTSRAATTIVSIAAILTASGGTIGQAWGYGMGRHGGIVSRADTSGVVGIEPGLDEDRDTPVDVPEPTFSS